MGTVAIAVWESLANPALIWVAIYLGLLLGLAEGGHRWGHYAPDLTRKWVHLGSGNVILLAWGLHLSSLLIEFAAICAAIVALLSYHLPILPSVNGVHRHSWGTFFYGVSIGIATLLFWDHAPHYTVVSILVMTWGDGLAGMVGQRWGRHPYQWGTIRKSWEGSLTMAVVSGGVTAVVLAIAGLGMGTVLGTSLVVAIAAPWLELPPWWGVDNLTVPLGTGMLAYYVGQLLP